MNKSMLWIWSESSYDPLEKKTMFRFGSDLRNFGFGSRYSDRVRIRLDPNFQKKKHLEKKKTLDSVLHCFYLWFCNNNGIIMV